MRHKFSTRWLCYKWGIYRLALQEIQKQRQSLLSSSFNEPTYGYKDGDVLTADENVILEVPEELEELRPKKK